MTLKTIKKFLKFSNCVVKFRGSEVTLTLSETQNGIWCLDFDIIDDSKTVGH